MYKVFVNEKELFLSKSEKSVEKNLKFEDAKTFEMGIDILQNTSCKALNIYFENSDALWENFKKSIITIEAAGGIVKNMDEEILFIKRMGKWDLPKGKIEIGESTENAALREVEEETGITHLEITEFITETYHIYTDRNLKNILKITHWFSMNYAGNEIPIPQIEEGISEVAWKNKRDIVEIVYPKTFKNIKMILENIGFH
ncbi:NUDIX hydrolase [Frigoriflavimonas asaccharolytica]|uniref:8-oxo-dGTP pyrophosphatase MutT (NUDIX family) n=1 Tax=Frigoriflavimonas asaccharolytica TaxID=2735899 RepID=A0A8J8K9P9_9FLAO|nr:NUDIX domain-containing protein [Frigoriflavimonas asaccharolytica]NRS93287.1 8-oxo-dGTP pyrophosphatase MutT (NUDIX family) [Frigoriflavimonas asaccharolytica]